MKIRYLLVMICAGVLAAQTTTAPRTPTFDALKAAIGLTDQQVTQLLDLRKQQRDAVRSTQEQIREKQNALQTALAAGSTDAAALGKLLIEIHALRKKAQTSAESFRTQALALLNAQQKANLAKLEEAVKLQPAIREASMLNLLVLPEPAGPGVAGPRAASGMRMMQRQMLRQRGLR